MSGGIRGWNWRAFLLHVVWGLGNNTLVALPMFVPLVNLAMPFVPGAKGSEWAWRNRQWHSVEAFKATQRRWAKAGVIVLVLGLVVVALAAYALLSMMKGTEVYRSSVTPLQADPDARCILGTPVTTDIPMGNIEVSGPGSSAQLSHSASGPLEEGAVHVEASRALGRWTIDAAEFEDGATQRRIDLTDDLTE